MVSLREAARTAQKSLAGRRTRKKAKKLKRRRTVERVKSKASDAVQPHRDLVGEVAKQPEVQFFTGRSKSGSGSTDSGGSDDSESLSEILLGGEDDGGDMSLDVVEDIGEGFMESDDSFEVVEDFDDF